MTGRLKPRVRIEVRTDVPEDRTADTSVWSAELDGHRCRTAFRFLVEIGVVLDFPYYYGRNWNAFNECFRELLEVTEGGMGSEFGVTSGRPGSALHLVVPRAEELLAEATLRDMAILASNLQHPYHRYDPPQLWHRYADLDVTFVCSPGAIASFRERLRAAEEYDLDTRA